MSCFLYNPIFISLHQSLRWNNKFVTKYYESKYDVTRPEKTYICAAVSVLNFQMICNAKKVIQIRFFLICFLTKYNTASKVSKYGVFSCPYFPVFGPEKTPYLDTFYAVKVFINQKVKAKNCSAFYISLSLVFQKNTWQYLKQKFQLQKKILTEKLLSRFLGSPTQRTYYFVSRFC